MTEPKKKSLGLIPYDEISEHECLFNICKSAMDGDSEAYLWLNRAGCITIKEQSSYFRPFENDRTGPDATKWREDVFERDNYICSMCGSGGEIQAHHIIPWAASIGTRFDINNGITLCKTCHSKLHPERAQLIMKSRYLKKHDRN